MDVRYDLGDDHRLVGTLCPDMKLTPERPDPDVVTAVTRSAEDLPREGRGLLLDLVDRAEVRDAAATWTGRVTTVTARTGRVDVDALLMRPDGCIARPCPPGRTSTPPRWCVRWAHGSANRPEHRINSRLSFAP
ncbi:hypothetical protein ACFZAD_27955 [Streptomyces iakyrus]|uniref:aromatic-ring hydroxylase C-terminal domain-containing protein n=1 Tax=Streptomyces iakyrus TaxID=68219 RepID=UPI0036ED1CC4